MSWDNIGKIIWNPYLTFFLKINSIWIIVLNDKAKQKQKKMDFRKQEIIFLTMREGTFFKIRKKLINFSVLT